jgi:histidinol-phosphatase
MEGVEDDLQLAKRAALAGAAVGMGYFAALAGLRHELKVDGSVVTEADRAVETTIRDVLGSARPDDAVLGEEHGQTGDAGGRRWIIDPIDGTALFVAGDNRWLVLLALEVDGVITVGVAVHPAQERMFWAVRGGGAFETGPDGVERPMSVDSGMPRTDELADAQLSVLPTFMDDKGANVIPKDTAVVAGLLAIAPSRPWDVHPPMLVARGQLDLAVQTGGQIWDFAATSLIVTEAGGSYRGADGGDRPRAGASVFARTELLASRAHAVVERMEGGSRPHAGIEGVDKAEQRT